MVGNDNLLPKVCVEIQVPYEYKQKLGILCV